MDEALRLRPSVVNNVCVTVHAVLFAGKNIYNGEHVAIKLVSVYFCALSPLSLSLSLSFPPCIRLAVC